MKLKGLDLADVAEFQEAVTEELKKVQKEEFSAFQKLFNRAKACVYANGAYFEFKKVCVSFMCPRFLKKISPKTFGPHCVCKHETPCI